MNRRFAQALSYLLHPAVHPLLGILIILELTPYFIETRILIYALLLVFTGTYIFPMAVSWLAYRMGYIESLEMRRADDRRLPYLIGALSYYIVAVAVDALGLPTEAYFYLLACTMVIVVHLIMLALLKPSAHLAGLGGLLGLLFSLSWKFSVNYLPLIAGALLLSGFLASARMYLKAHDGKEILLGFFSGLVVVILVMLYT